MHNVYSLSPGAERDAKMVQQKHKTQHNPDVAKQKQWPLVTSSVCEVCPVQCPAGVEYMDNIKKSGKAARGVVCKRPLYEERIRQGLLPFEDTLKLWKAPK